jgi:CDP-diacylglycerol--glycerol-3-phosphate 3-phosphatidyltransferase
MFGLYALKPWYASRLGGVRRMLATRGISPNAVTLAGVAFGAATGVAFVGLRPGLGAAALVAVLLAARLACANLDGGLARETGRATRFGVITNEAGDRLAELAALAGLLALASPTVVAASALAASAPSWVALAGASAGAPRVQGGPVGKTERCLILVAIAATGWATPLLVALGLGSLATAGVRLIRLRRELMSEREEPSSRGPAACERFVTDLSEREEPSSRGPAACERFVTDLSEREEPSSRGPAACEPSLRGPAACERFVTDGVAS